MTEPIEGFDIVDGKYICTYQYKFETGIKQCGKEYVRKLPAEHHRDSHAAYEEHARLQRREQYSQAMKGDAVRELIIAPLRNGKFDVPELISNLETVALGVDLLHAEIEKADLRVLRRKADAWDKMLTLIAAEDLSSFVEASGAAHQV